MSWSDRGMEYSPHIQEPMQLEWLGWWSDIRTLQRNGWEFAETTVPAYDGGGECRNFRFRHREADVVGSTGRFDFHPHMHPDEVRHRMQGLRLPCRLSHRLIIQEQVGNPLKYTAVDCTMRSEKHSVYNATYFRPIDNDARKIFLEKASLEDIMQLALDKQAPEQARIRRKMADRQERLKYVRPSSLGAELRLVV